MRMYKIFIFLVPLLLCQTAIGAGLSTKVDYGEKLQNTIDSEHTEVKKLQKRKPKRLNFDDELNFSDQQKKVVREILSNSRKKIDEQIKIINTAYDEIENIHRQDEEKIRQILNPQQKIKFDKLQYKKQKSSKEKSSAEKPSRKRIRQY